MPPASRGFGYNSFHHVFRIYGFRPHQGQRRFSTKLPRKPVLPPKIAVQAAIARRVKAEAQVEAQAHANARAQMKDTEKRWKILPRMSLPPLVRWLFQGLSPPSWLRHLLGRISPPSWARRWIWNVFLFGPPVAVFLMAFPLSFMRVEGPSMAPLFNVKSSPDVPASPFDRLIVRKVHVPETLANLFGQPKLNLERGQIVVYYAPHDPSSLAVKRVIGLPGDRVQPLPGYPGGDDKPVMIRYNHIWVEGDANSRKDSVDSNYFGPISQNMVYGFVLGAYTPWWWWFGRPRHLKWEEDDYPAKNSGRVEKDVVKSAKLDPDQEARLNLDPFKDGRAALELAMIRQKRHLMPQKMREKGMTAVYRNMYARAKAEVEKGNPRHKEVAEGLIDELEIVFESVGLNNDGSQMTPVLKGQRQVNEDKEDVKQRRLQEYLARQRAADPSHSKDSYASTE